MCKKGGCLCFHLGRKPFRSPYWETKVLVSAVNGMENALFMFKSVI